MSPPHEPFADESPPLAPGETDRPSAIPSPPSPAADAGMRRRLINFSAVLSVMLGCGFLCLLLIMCIGGHPAAVLFVAGVFAFAAFHYLVWGWWLSKRINRQNVNASDPARDAD